jgi:hypothetical protein
MPLPRLKPFGRSQRTTGAGQIEEWPKVSEHILGAIRVVSLVR